MYVQPKDDDDEIKTNPDLFSDTNSNRGSQATVEDGMFPIPDSASEASVEVGQFHMQKKPIQYRQRLNKHELDVSILVCYKENCLNFLISYPIFVRLFLHEIVQFSDGIVFLGQWFGNLY